VLIQSPSQTKTRRDGDQRAGSSYDKQSTGWTVIRPL
jgi:hypothetical protein